MRLQVHALAVDVLLVHVLVALSQRLLQHSLLAASVGVGLAVLLVHACEVLFVIADIDGVVLRLVGDRLRPMVHQRGSCVEALLDLQVQLRLLGLHLLQLLPQLIVLRLLLLQLLVFLVSVASQKLELVLQGFNLALKAFFLKLDRLLILLKLFDLGFQVVHVDLHFVLQPDVASDVSFKLLDDLLVHSGRFSVACVFLNGLPIQLFIGFNHVQQGFFHALLDQVLALDRQPTDRCLSSSTHVRIAVLLFLTLLAFVLLEVVDLEVHNNFDAAADILEYLEAIDRSHELPLLVLEVVIVDLVEFVSRADLDGQVQVDDGFFDVA